MNKYELTGEQGVVMRFELPGYAGDQASADPANHKTAVVIAQTAAAWLGVHDMALGHLKAGHITVIKGIA